MHRTKRALTPEAKLCTYEARLPLSGNNYDANFTCVRSSCQMSSWQLTIIK